MDALIVDLTFAQTAWILAVLATVAGAAFLAAPGASRAAIAAFPRSTPAAWIFAGLDLLWVAWIVYHAPLGRFEFLKPGLYVATPLSFFLLITYLDDLLAARAFGGFLLLAAYPLVRGAQWHESDWRLAVITVGYAWAVAGMAFVMSPYLFRRWCAPWIADNSRARIAGALKLAGGAGFAAIALFVA